MKQLFLIASLAALAPLAAQTKTSAPAFTSTVTGQGRDIVLIPGLASSGAVWEGTVAHLKEHYKCHSLTLAGFAGNPRVDGPFLETMRSAIAGYIRDRHLDRPVIIGHSLGGVLALMLASHDPGLTGPLVIVNSLPFLPAVFTPGATADSMRPMAEQMRDGMSKSGDMYEKNAEMSIRTMVTSPANFQLVASWSKTTDPVASANAMYDMFTTDLRADVARITAPTLVLGTWLAYRDNEQDTATRGQTEKNFQAQYAQLKGVKIVLADHARHFIMLDDPDWFYEQLDNFLK